MHKMTILSDNDIRAGLDDGSVVIVPFNDSHVNPASYNITLGEYYYRPADYPGSEDKVLLTWDPQSVRDYWGTTPYHLTTEDDGLMILPGKSILAHSHEFIGIRGNATTVMKARSSMSRACI